MSVKNQIHSLSRLYTLYEKVPESFLDQTDVDSYFYHSIIDISQTGTRLVRLSKGSNKNLFALKVFEFCDLRTQQRFILKEEVTITKKELASLLNNLRSFLKQYDSASKFPLYPLPTPKQEIGFTLWKDELFAHHFIDIKEHQNRQLRLSFRFDKDKKCCFSLKKFESQGEQFILTDIVNLSHSELYYVYKNRYFIASKCDIFQSNYDV